jgi:hypothetical protein
VPPLLRATTENVYDVDANRPGTLHESPGDATVHVSDPGLDVTKYPVIVTPVTGDGAVQLTFAVELFKNELTVTPVGAFGVAADAGSTLIETARIVIIDTATTLNRFLKILIWPPCSSNSGENKQSSLAWIDCEHVRLGSARNSKLRTEVKKSPATIAVASAR